MAKVFIEETTLTAIGDAIRGKTGKTELIDPANMSTEIASIEAGGGGYEIPEEAFKITGNASNRFAYGGWNWFLEEYGHKITTENINNAASMFQASGLTEIPFQINLTDCTACTYMFNSTRLTVCPKVRGTLRWSTGNPNLSQMINSQDYLRDVEDLFDPEMLNGYSTVKVTSAYSSPNPPSLGNMKSMRKVPTWWYKLRLNEESTAYPANSYSIYNSTFSACYVLDEIRDVPVWRCVGACTSNMMSSMVNSCTRLKAFTFETNADGSPIETKWKAQTLEFSSNLGYDTQYSSNIILYNSGITADKEVKDDASYQALKNDPDWWTRNSAYSRYNHDSAVETINSLPDTSAYLVAAGGTNTIKFKKTAGSATDGGAIENLTEAEIAVAAAKGWTVTLV